MRSLPLALTIALLPLAVTAAETTTAVAFAQARLKAAKNPVYGLFSRQKPTVERHGTVTALKLDACAAPSEVPAFRQIPLQMTDFCQQHGGTEIEGQVNGTRCEVQSADGPALWFTAQLVPLGTCGPAGVSSTQALQLIVHEVDADQRGTTSADVDWMSVGIKPARPRAFKQRSAETAQAAAEQFRVENQAAALKTKGTQVCQLKTGGGEFVGFVEDASGDRIKVLVVAYYWDSLKIGRRDTSFVQQYTWSNFADWRLC